MFSSRKSSAPASGALALTKSLRFRSSATAYLNRTFGTPTNNLKYTLSLWVKRGTLGTQNILFDGGDTTGNNNAYLQFNPSDQLNFSQNTAGNGSINLITTQIFRDASAWYHIVLAVDTTQATSTDRVKIYINGVQITSFGTAVYPTLNLANQVNVASRVHNIGKLDYYALYLDAYLTDVYFIDGQQLTPSSFASTNATTGQWSPGIYSGSYGTNGFHLTFANTASTTTLGYDTSGNSNNWTTNNISLTAGSTYDSMNDVPTLTSATASNYAVLNPNNSYTGLLSNGNLTLTSGASGWQTARSSIYVSTGKWYWEVTMVNDNLVFVGLDDNAYNVTTNGSSTYVGFYTNSWSIYFSNGQIRNNTGSGSAYGSAFSIGDVCMVALDMTNGKVYWGKNGTWFNSGNPATQTNPAFTNLSGYTLGPATSGFDSTSIATHNFGQQPFTYTPPTGYVALNTYNLPTPTIAQGNKYMDATTFTGVTGAIAVMNAGSFQPDLVWVKSRSNTQDNYLVDSNRGGNYLLRSSTSSADGVYASPNWITSFNSNGFSSSSDSLLSINYSYVAWQWQAGKGSNVSNTSGTITSTVSASTTAGFSIVTFTAPSSGSGTVGHGLGATPSMMIWKSRSNTDNWTTYHISLGSNALFLNLSNASSALSWGTINSTIFTADTGSNCTASRTYVAYCFAPIAGFSAFGSYTGNGSATAGPFVYTGFRPKFVLVKRTDSTGDWRTMDTSRDLYNPEVNVLFPDLSQAEASYTGGQGLIGLSNGFQTQITSADVNASGGTYIYMAFAENPFQYANAR